MSGLGGYGPSELHDGGDDCNDMYYDGGSNVPEGIPMTEPTTSAGGRTYRGIRRYSAGDGYRTTYVCCVTNRDSPHNNRQIWLGRYYEPQAAAMAYDVFCVFNHRDSQLNFPELLPLYCRFVPRRGIHPDGARMVPITAADLEMIKHIGLGLIRAFWPSSCAAIHTRRNRKALPSSSSPCSQSGGSSAGVSGGSSSQGGGASSQYNEIEDSVRVAALVFLGTQQGLHRQAQSLLLGNNSGTSNCNNNNINNHNRTGSPAPPASARCHSPKLDNAGSSSARSMQQQQPKNPNNGFNVAFSAMRSSTSSANCTQSYNDMPPPSPCAPSLHPSIERLAQQASAHYPSSSSLGHYNNSSGLQMPPPLSSSCSPSRRQYRSSEPFPPPLSGRSTPRPRMSLPQNPAHHHLAAAHADPEHSYRQGTLTARGGYSDYHHRAPSRSPSDYDDTEVAYSSCLMQDPGSSSVRASMNHPKPKHSSRSAAAADPLYSSRGYPHSSRSGRPPSSSGKRCHDSGIMTSRRDEYLDWECDQDLSSSKPPPCELQLLDNWNESPCPQTQASNDARNSRHQAYSALSLDLTLGPSGSSCCPNQQQQSCCPNQQRQQSCCPNQQRQEHHLQNLFQTTCPPPKPKRVDLDTPMSCTGFRIRPPRCDVEKPEPTPDDNEDEEEFDPTTFIVTLPRPATDFDEYDGFSAVRGYYVTVPRRNLKKHERNKDAVAMEEGSFVVRTKGLPDPTYSKAGGEKAGDGSAAPPAENAEPPPPPPAEEATPPAPAPAPEAAPPADEAAAPPPEGDAAPSS